MENGPRHTVAREFYFNTSYHDGAFTDRPVFIRAIRLCVAFLTFLRTNLELSARPPRSTPKLRTLAPTFTPFELPISPPLSRPSSSSASSFVSESSSVFSSRASSTSSSISIPDDDISPLSLQLLSSKSDRDAALDLIADSIAEQRVRAVVGLVHHPVCIIGAVVVLLLVWRLGQGNIPLSVALCCSAMTTYLSTLWFVTREYLLVSEELGPEWLWGPYGAGSEDLVLGARSGTDLVGAVVIRLQQPNVSGSGKRRTRTASMKGGKGVIRAWTTRVGHRRKGIGADMLYEAVRLIKERCGRDSAVGFAKEHANSVKILPDMFNGPFRTVERKATKALDAVLVEWDANKKRR